MSEVKQYLTNRGELLCADSLQPAEVYRLVDAKDYDALAAEAQALREEVAALRMARDDFKLERDLARQNFCDEQAANYQLQAHLKSCLGELAELRARVAVVPEPLNEGDARRECGEYGAAMQRGYNACLRALARLNGLTVSEGLLRRLARPADRYDEVFTLDRHEAAEELRALLSEQA
ncbi:TPA: hypothetical protein ACKPYC_001141 [Pseudomonas aeruginosa]|uniref:hypothetical protein n=1 Tax=Pseudomonas aeruginosa TaxID=287 RepID=UPI00053ECBBD|nr:hypothetical protein [Pseudomonas aeruginosa]QBI81038.1 hypothetical protein [Pseudomonas phage vB_Pae_BR141b]KSG18049.1 hypothetical protein AO946_31395 [Pseudomonas aeruginosa]MBG6738292.1 hypothetical protein [Pseudomonas aeruginosa]MBH3787556.1 hypothetical protein [Pseudomonas aeruginosa]MBV5631335.1 hypothetical protein [Pseudomonas aeruginosa]